MNYLLDPHGEMILQQYRDWLPIFQRLDELVYNHLRNAIEQQGLYITSIEHRIKKEDSLAGKLMRKGHKYIDINSLTDIVGIRIITFYTDDVDKVAAIAKRALDIDWKESVDKRKLHDLDSFGYNSLHFICRLPKSVVDDPNMPELNKIRFELQMRTALQHVWSTIEHDTGYKGTVKIPREYLRQFSRLAGMLELIDDEFSRLRITLTDYRRRIQSLVASGQLQDVELDSDSFHSYLELHPFDRLNKRIAAVNQAEIYPVSLKPFIRVFEKFSFTTLGDLDHFITENSDEAYLLALSQLAFTDLDILSENIGVLNLCIVHTLKNGGGLQGLIQLYDIIYGPQETNTLMARLTLEQAMSLPFMQNHVQ
jgi:ppGpp synthetase/RelA/SpoT-type nucleotidyltranferase